VSPLTPLGTARDRFLSAGATEQEQTGTAQAAPPEDDFEPWYLGWEMARCARGLTPDAATGAAALAAACIAAMRAGSTRLPLDEGSLASALALAAVPGALPAALAVVARARAAVAGDPVTQLFGGPGERKPLVIDAGWLYAQRMHSLEESFSRRVQERLGRAGKGRETRSLNRAVAAVTAGPPPLTDEQKRAVQQGVAAPIALITGGPGTGKTTIVVALVRALAWLGERPDAMGIGAPTGKAAQRLHEALRAGLASAARDIADVALPQMVPPPQTLHRLLGWSPQTGRFAHHENNPLPYRVVVVDEASMIDLAMMDRLLRALAPDARLVLLGDADQLPSVEAGAVFRDLCAGLGAVRLTVNLRVAREPSAQRIVAAAQAVNAGRLDERFAGAVATRDAVEELRFEGVEHLAAPWSAVGEAVLDAWWGLRIASLDGFAERATRAFRAKGGAVEPADAEELSALFDLYASSRVLCATRVSGFPASVEAVNDSMLARLTGGRSRASRWRRAVRLAAGAPVVVERNDYERQLYNGDSGVIVRAHPGDGGPLLAVFRRPAGVGVASLGATSFEAIPLDALGDTSPAFAMTVHKAQGSEFDHVLVVLPEEDMPLLTRELVYTALTRARRSVLVVGDRELLARSVGRVVQRHCGLAEKLRRSATS
jgi:exodeoxyribonuclease V alpha subunit